jgi:riboflavin biosynthesis pyrimidine reductase
MVEGGARVITSFLKARLADQVVLTISPQFVGGLRGVKRTRKWAHHPPRLADVAYETYGGDLVVFGSLRGAPAGPLKLAAKQSRPDGSASDKMETENR